MRVGGAWKKQILLLRTRPRLVYCNQYGAENRSNGKKSKDIRTRTQNRDPEKPTPVAGNRQRGCMPLPTRRKGGQSGNGHKGQKLYALPSNGKGPGPEPGKKKGGVRTGSTDDVIQSLGFCKNLGFRKTGAQIGGQEGEKGKLRSDG